MTTKISGLHEAAFWLAVFSGLSLVLAFLRDRILTHNFGASAELDVYYAAFKIPDLIFVTIASLVSVSALVPLFAKKESEGERHLKDATNSIFTVFSASVLAACLAAWFLMPCLVARVFASLPLSAQAETIFLSRILLLSPLLLGLSNFFGSIVQYEKRFILYSLSPLLYNVGIIAGLVAGVGTYGIRAAVAGVCIGALLHLLLQAFFVLRSPRKPMLTMDIKWKDIWETARLSIPRTFALSVVSIVGFVFAALAAGLGEGSIAVFNLAFNLQSVLLSLIGVSFSLAAFPALAQSAARKNIPEAVERLGEGLRQIIFWSLPAMALLIVLRAHVVRVVLGSGVFDWSATRLTAAMFALFIASAVFQSLQLFLSRSHYALGKTRWPLIANTAGGLVAISLAVYLLRDFQDLSFLFGSIASALNIEDLALKPLALPLSFSVGSIVTSFLLFAALGREYRGEVWRLVNKSAWQTLVTALVTGFTTYYALALFDGLFDLDFFLGVLGHGLTAGIVGILSGALTLAILGNKEYKLVFAKIRFKKLNLPT